MITLRWRWIAIVLILLGVWKFWPAQALKLPQGSVAPNDPVQTEPDRRMVFQHGQYALTVLANFEIEARVLGKALYRSGRESELAPVDLALGWGAMSDSAVLDQLSITQSGRFYHYRWEQQPPLPPPEIVRHSANMHLIPADAEVEHKMKEARVGQVVHLVGHLVEARAPDGWRWRSSLTRTDTGAGACELFRVESFEFR